MDKNGGDSYQWDPDDWDPNAVDWRGTGFSVPAGSGPDPGQGSAYAGPDFDAGSDADVDFGAFLDLGPDAAPGVGSGDGPPPGYATLTSRQRGHVRQTERENAKKQGRKPAEWAAKKSGGRHPADATLSSGQLARVRRTERENAEKEGRKPADWAARRREPPADATLTPRQRASARQAERLRAEKEGRKPADWAAKKYQPRGAGAAERPDPLAQSYGQPSEAERAITPTTAAFASMAIAGPTGHSGPNLYGYGSGTAGPVPYDTAGAGQQIHSSGAWILPNTGVQPSAVWQNPAPTSGYVRQNPAKYTPPAQNSNSGQTHGNGRPR